MKKIAKFFIGIKSEMKNVKWPTRKEMVKYSIATIVFVLFFGVFFYLIEVLMWALNQLV
jgi:preprotein translocase subunit SecE